VTAESFTYRGLPLTPGVPRVIEAKRHPGDAGHRFECELVAVRPGLVVVCLPLEASYGMVDSYGLFWARRPYNVYHLVPREAGAPIRTRFDVLRDMHLDVTDAGGEVSYVDLYLDLWVTDGAPRWEDEQDVEDARAAGVLSDVDLARIARGRAVLERGYPRIVREVRATLQALGRRA
jgi:hypothetical protein